MKKNKKKIASKKSKKVTTKKTKKVAKPYNPTIQKPVGQMTAEQKAIGEMLEHKIAEILGPKRTAKFVGPVTVGPVITTYRFQPQQRTKVSHLEGMAKDFAVLLQAESVLVKRMPGQATVGVFVPNKDRTIINFKDTIQHVITKAKEQTSDGHKVIPLNLGQDSDGNPFVDDLTMQPHVLIAGTTGGGKSTLLHSIVTGLAYAMTPAELQLVISDTKGVEFPHLKELPHLKSPLATNVYMTLQEMKTLAKETQERMDRFQMTGDRNIHDYNKRAGDHKMPYIVLVIDELADLMGRHVDKDIAAAASASLQEIVQRSRAAGVYVIAGTQRPDVKTVAGAIKANFPSRLSFRLPSGNDSRTVLGTKGAENLMSRGDMLYASSLSPELKRLHAPFTSIEDVYHAVNWIKHQYATNSTGAGAPTSAPGSIPLGPSTVQ